MKKLTWFDRKFNFQQNDVSLFPLVLERLRCTPVRLEERISLVPAQTLRFKLHNTWSIQENAGHLGDLENLWFERLLDILDGKPNLRLADLTNTKTDQAKHNDQPLISVLQNFRQLRSETFNKLEALPPHDLLLSAIHPRLKTPMRIADLFLFVAEHDDHHLARITELLNVK